MHINSHITTFLLREVRFTKNYLHQLIVTPVPSIMDNVIKQNAIKQSGGLCGIWICETAMNLLKSCSSGSIFVDFRVFFSREILQRCFSSYSPLLDKIIKNASKNNWCIHFLISGEVQHKLININMYIQHMKG